MGRGNIERQARMHQGASEWRVVCWDLRSCTLHEHPSEKRNILIAAGKTKGRSNALCTLYYQAIPLPSPPGLSSQAGPGGAAGQRSLEAMRLGCLEAHGYLQRPQTYGQILGISEISRPARLRQIFPDASVRCPTRPLGGAARDAERGKRGRAGRLSSHAREAAAAEPASAAAAHLGPAAGRLGVAARRFAQYPRREEGRREEQQVTEQRNGWPSQSWSCGCSTCSPNKCSFILMTQCIRSREMELSAEWPGCSVNMKAAKTAWGSELILSLGSFSGRTGQRRRPLPRHQDGGDTRGLKRMQLAL
ncbi:uncharacterized protein LOC100895764 [Callithrix jacchus]